MSNVPCLVIGGAHSGVGKSTITLALIATLRQRGLRVQTFKVGPDYLDPTHLSRVSGQPCYNLDSWMCNESYIQALFNRACKNADIAIIEGVMGLFDGSSPCELSGSTAQIAKWLNAPVLLVVNAHGMARSFAALVQGFTNFAEDVVIDGVIANMCGSKSHGKLLQQALECSNLPPLIGAIERGAFPQLPSRHLGLLPASETAWDAELIEQLGATAAEYINIDALLAKLQHRSKNQQTAAPTTVMALSPATVGKVGTIAIARDEAFQFYYDDLFSALTQRGIEIKFFSVLHDTALPDNCSALYLGGGYPEVYAKQLAANTAMLQEIRSFCQSNRPVYAECGGLIYLSQGIENDDQFYNFAAVLPCRVRMLKKRKALGYVAVTLQQPTLFGAIGTTLRGHEFHYSELCSDPVGIDGWQAAYQLKYNRSGRCVAEGYQKGNILASYAHLHLAGHPEALNCFVNNICSTN